MGLLEKAKWAWDNVGMMASLLEKWRPRNCVTEKDYEKNLCSFLHRELPDFRITPQYAKGRFRADLQVGKNMFIEIKHNLNTTAKLQRLMGQVASYGDWEGKFVLLLVGKTDSDLKEELIRFLKKQGLMGGLYDDKMAVIEK